MHQSAQPNVSDFVATLCAVFGTTIVSEKLKPLGLSLNSDNSLLSHQHNENEIYEFLVNEFQHLAPNVMEHINRDQQNAPITPQVASHTHSAHSPARDDIESFTNTSVKPQSHEWFESISGHVLNEQLVHINPNF